MRYNIGDRIRFKNSKNRNEIYKVLEYNEEEGYKTRLEQVGATVIIPNWQIEYTELVNEQVSEQVSKYKVGDIVKLSTGERATITIMFRDNVNEVFRYSATIGDDDYDEYNLDEKEIVGLWEECNSVNSSVKKYKLIDILNKIANGELKEGTVVVWDDVEYPYKNKCLYGADGEKLFYWINTGNLNDEVELIEPQETKECEHEWSKYSIGRLGRTENYRRCKKCGIHEEDIEPTDNTKIEELIADEINGKSLAEALSIIGGKVNEVIRHINKGAEK